jgi:hypothetical protein
VGDSEDNVDQRFCAFGQHALGDAEIWALSAATMVLPDGNPGAEAYLVQVAGAEELVPGLTLWGRAVARGIASALYKARDGKRRRAYVEGYDESWGIYAVADGLTLALFGKAPGLEERVVTLGCGRQAYQRIRDFVGGALLCALAEYRCALEWASGLRRDRVFEGRWEGVTGLKWSEIRRDETMGYHRGSSFPRFAPGCDRTVPLKDHGDLYADQPETLYYALRPSNWWDAGQVARMRHECRAITLYPTTDHPPRC